jgi:copper oxidase (laccase) domain-containing protein
VAIGPAISGAVYQVSQDVASQVIQTLPSSVHAQVLIEDPDPEKARLNLPEVNKLQIMMAGFSEDQISISPFCTWTDSEHFFSYRRLGSQLKDTEGRPRVQWSGIGIAGFPRV